MRLGLRLLLIFAFLASTAPRFAAAESDSNPEAASQSAGAGWKGSVARAALVLVAVSAFSSACAPFQPAPNSCDLSRTAVSDTIDTIQKADTAVGWIGDRQPQKAKQAIYKANVSYQQARKALDDAAPVAAVCGPAATRAVSDARDALAQAQQTISDDSSALNSGGDYNRLAVAQAQSDKDMSQIPQLKQDAAEIPKSPGGASSSSGGGGSGRTTHR